MPWCRNLVADPDRISARRRSVIGPRPPLSGLYLILDPSINPGREQVIANEQLVTQASADTTQIESEVQIMRSPATMRRVVDMLRLEEDPEWNTALAPPGGLRAVLAPLRNALGGERPAGGAMTEDQREGLREAIAGALAAAVTIERRSNSFIVTVSARARAPQSAQRIANTLVQSYLDAQVETQFAATERANDFLQRRVGELAEELQAKEREAEAFRRTHGLSRAAGGVEQPQTAEVQTMLVAAHPDDLLGAQRAGLKTAYVPRPLEHGPKPLVPPPAGAKFDYTAVDFLELARQLGA